MSFGEREIGVRTLRVGITANDVAAMFGDSLDAEVHTSLLVTLVRIIPSWEAQGVDWVEHLRGVLATTPRPDRDTLKLICQELLAELENAENDDSRNGNSGTALGVGTAEL